MIQNPHSNEKSKAMTLAEYIADHTHSVKIYEFPLPETKLKYGSRGHNCKVSLPEDFIVVIPNDVTCKQFYAEWELASKELRRLYHRVGMIRFVRENEGEGVSYQELLDART